MAELAAERLEDPIPRKVDLDGLIWTHDGHDFIPCPKTYENDLEGYRMPFTIETAQAIRDMWDRDDEYDPPLLLGTIEFFWCHGEFSYKHIDRPRFDRWYVSSAGINRLFTLLDNPYQQKLFNRR
jgi:hypothetical protein